MLCKYKNIFGEPRKGAHSYRIFDIAVVDVALTVLGAWLLSYSFKWNFYITLASLFLFGIFCHWLFCVDTKVARELSKITDQLSLDK